MNDNWKSLDGSSETAHKFAIRFGSKLVKVRLQSWSTVNELARDIMDSTSDLDELVNVLRHHFDLTQLNSPTFTVINSGSGFIDVDVVDGTNGGVGRVRILADLIQETTDWRKKLYEDYTPSKFGRANFMQDEVKSGQYHIRMGGREVTVTAENAEAAVAKVARGGLTFPIAITNTATDNAVHIRSDREYEAKVKRVDMKSELTLENSFAARVYVYVYQNDELKKQLTIPVSKFDDDDTFDIVKQIKAKADPSVLNQVLHGGPKTSMTVNLGSNVVVDVSGFRLHA